jgi:cytochrome c oxidase cbb3-type subunit 1
MTLPYKSFPDLLALVFAAAGLTVGVMLVVKASDAGTQFEGAVLALTCAVFFGVLGKIGSTHSDDVIKAAVIAALFWGIAGLLIGDCVAWQLAFPALNFDLPWTNFSSLRGLHISVMTFAFCGNALLASSFYALQRTSGGSLHWRLAPWFVLAGYNAFIVIAGSGYILGITADNDRAGPEWVSNLWLTCVWIVCLAVFLGTIWHRKEPRIHVANWFYFVFIVTGAMLHIVNNTVVPASFLASNSGMIFPGVQQWWYAPNGAGFFLTAGFLGTMYYFMPARTGRAVYSNKAAMAHCLVLCFIFVWFRWLGSQRLHFTAYPDWVNNGTMAFSVSLWLAFLAGMINGLTPLAGALSKLRTDPVIRFLAVAIVIMVVDTALHYSDWKLAHQVPTVSLQHYTDWTIGHHHPATAGWGTLMMSGALYCLVPWLWKRKELHSTALVEWHFWLTVLGILLYFGSMWISGRVLGLLWRTNGNPGNVWYSFVETVEAMHPYYILRAVGGALIVLGALIMVINLWMTVTAQPTGTGDAGTAAAGIHDAG